MRWIVLVLLLASCGPPTPIPPEPNPQVPVAFPRPLPHAPFDPLPTAIGPLLVVLSREFERDLAGQVTVRGRFANTGRLPARQAEAILRLYDANGLVIETRRAPLMPDYLEPGYEGWYSLSYGPEIKPTFYALWLRWLN